MAHYHTRENSFNVLKDFVREDVPIRLEDINEYFKPLTFPSVKYIPVLTDAIVWWTERDGDTLVVGVSDLLIMDILERFFEDVRHPYYDNCPEKAKEYDERFKREVKFN